MNISNTVLYTGITSNLVGRVYQHKQKLTEGFTKRYNIDKLVYFEVFEDPEIAIKREKTIKNMVRRKKLALITKHNPTFKDFYTEILSG